MDDSFLGTGWDFPVSFNRNKGEVSMLSDVADIESSLQVLLSTRLGERVMQPSYGCNLDELAFESITATLKSFVKDLIETAILFHEPRIRLNKVTIDEDQHINGVIHIKIDYTVRRTNTRYNYVYPYYINEGTEL